MSGQQVSVFAGFQLDPARRRLTSPDGGVVALQPRVFDLLSVFVAHPGELLAKQVLMDAVWPDTTVDENNLNQAVSTLRRALGESPAEPRLIATVPRRGYQLIVPVELVSREPGVEAPSAPPAEAPASDPPTPEIPRPRTAGALLSIWRGLSRARRIALAGGLALVLGALLAGIAALRPPAPPEASVAVLPFRDLSPSGDQGYFADGVADEILNELAHLDGLRVAGSLSSAAAARTSQDPRAIGRALGVANVLVGGVRKEGGRLRVTAQLIAARDGFQLWSETFDRELDDVFAIQDEIAAAVAEALSVELGVPIQGGARTETASAEAYDHYLRGRAFWGQSGAAALRAAMEELRAAVAIDPGFAAAWATIAQAADFMVVVAPDEAPQLRSLEAEAAARALAAAPAAWESLALQGRLAMRRRDWSAAAAALAEADRVARPTPEEAAEIEGVFLLETGRAADASRIFAAARASDPLSLNAAASAAWALDLTGEPEAALTVQAEAAALPGDSSVWAFIQLLRLLAAGDADAVDRHLAHYPYQDEEAVSVLLERLAPVWRNREASLEILREALDDPRFAGRLDGLAVLAAYYGDADLAVRMFRKELLERGSGAAVHLWHPLVRQVRRTGEFAKLVDDLGLAAYWRASGQWGDFCRPEGEGVRCF